MRRQITKSTEAIWNARKCYTFQMSDSIVSLQYGNCCGPSFLEACLNVFSLYRLQCWILASTCCFEGPLQPNNRLFWGKNTSETDRQAKMKWSEPLTVLEWSLWADPVNATMCVCVHFYVCVRVSARWTFSVEQDTQRMWHINILKLSKKQPYNRMYAMASDNLWSMFSIALYRPIDIYLFVLYNM